MKIKKYMKKELTKEEKEMLKEKRRQRYHANKEKEIAKVKEYQENNKELLKEKRKQKYTENREKQIAKVKEYNLKNKDKKSEYRKSFIEKNKEYLRSYNKSYFFENQELLKEKRKEYRELNKEKIKEQQKIYKENYKIRRNELRKERKENDPLYKLSCNIRSLINQSLKNNGYKKESRTHEILGCSFEDFKNHIESQFTEWMNWSNYGNPKDCIFEPNKTWDIDHIKPISAYTNEQELLGLNHYTNLQPLCSYHNRYEKRSNI